MKTAYWLGYVIALAYFLPNPVSAAGKTDCESSADNLVFACTLDTHEELNVTIANCKNITDRDERRECRREAFRNKREERFLCDDQFEARLDACDLLNERRYDPDPLLDDSLEFIDPDEIGTSYMANPFLDLTPGKTSVLRAGEDFEEINVINVTDEVREIQGVLCRVVVDAVVEAEVDDDGDLEFEAVEITDDWYAQDTNGNVYYCGEVSRNFEDGVLRDLDGSFEAGVEFAKAGVLIRANPQVGDIHRQEFALDEAEDIVQYVSLATGPGADEGGENPNFVCGDACLKTFEFDLLEPESSEFKYYIPNLGFVLAVDLEDGEFSGEREELVCQGDSIEVLEASDCGIEDPDELIEELCELAPEAFCD